MSAVGLTPTIYGSWEYANRRRFNPASAALSVVLTVCAFGLFLMHKAPDLPASPPAVEYIPPPPKDPPPDDWKPVPPAPQLPPAKDLEIPSIDAQLPPAIPAESVHQAPVFEVVRADPRGTVTNPRPQGAPGSATGAVPGAPVVGTSKVLIQGTKRDGNPTEPSDKPASAARQAAPELDEQRSLAQIEAVFSRAKDKFVDEAQSAAASDGTVTCFLDIQPSGKATARCAPDREGLGTVAKGFERVIREKLDFGKAKRLQRFEKPMPIMGIR